MAIARNNSQLKEAELRSETFTNLASQLNSISSAREAAEVIVVAADELIGWDACLLTLYFPDSDQVQTILSVDTINGRRVEVPSTKGSHQPSPMARRTMTEGKQLILTTPESAQPPMPKCNGLRRVTSRQVGANMMFRHTPFAG
ncbi:MAG: hypothetical protein L0332_28690 [Chloroflexi bacterium]|nr:hypothetical protein [Chloroflexota bacterium]MCI0580568.1 hypothetical protein [Chloroflexota bacterium]MCI0647600.1 hypothetical protein [Chloroflexota bacterium]MCI0730677.1 hypothetical protein [Chloroflexota bacterium]